MSITQLLDDLAHAGIKLSVEADNLKLRAPKGALTEDLRTRLGTHKQALLDLLREARADLSVLPQIVPDPDARFEPFPLTDIQQAYWIGGKSGMDFGDFGIHIYTEIDCTDLDLERFTRAFRAVIARHDMLRAVVDREGRQRILATVPAYTPGVTDTRDLTGEAREAALVAVRERLSHSHRDHEVWPGFEVHASHTGARTTRLHFSIDLLHIDGGSLQLLFQDIVAYYKDPEASLPALGLSYRDYVLAEQALHDTDMYKQSLGYWRDRLPALPAAPLLPTRAMAEGEQARFRHDSAVLDGASWGALKAQIKRLGFSPPAVLLTAYAEALACWSSERDLTVNVTVFNRLPMHPQVGEILGDFTSMVLMGIAHEPGDTFMTRVKRVQEHLWGAFEHRHVSGVRVLRELARVRGSAQAAMMPVVFTSFLNLEDDGSTAPSSAMRALGDITFSQTQTPQVWLDHQVIEDGGVLLLSYDMMVNIFPEGMIPELFDGYKRLLARLAAPDAWEHVPGSLISDDLMARIAEVNRTDVPLPEGSLYDAFRRQVEADPHKPALIAGGSTFSYGELDRRAARLGHWLQRHGVQRDQLVAVVMEKGAEQVSAVLGILAAGAAYLPVDPDLPDERFHHLLHDGAVRLVLTSGKLAGALNWEVGLTVLPLDTERETEHLPDTPPQNDAGAHSLAYVLYTSGSTGKPKGVMIEHLSVRNRMDDIAARYGVGPGDRTLGVSALHHDLSVFDLFGILTHGAALVLPRAERRLDPAHWAELMVREQVTLWNSVPTFLNMLVEYLEGLDEAARAAAVPAALRWVILAGDWIPVNLPARLRRLVPDVAFTASGGPTESTVWDIHYEVGEVDETRTSIPYGKPLANARYYVLHDNLDPCPEWVPGELYIAGAGLARGYWKNEEASKAFFQHPRTGLRLYRSGDLGRRLPDGNIEILGRKDFQVKIRGMRIELGEIETTLTRHPSVKAAVVNLMGERFGDQRLVGYIVRREDSEETPELLAEELRAFLNEKLPPYMVPSVFMELARLPMGATGKVDRKALPAPEAQAAQAGAFTAPRTETETALAAIWAEALHLDSLSVTANLIDLGLNSLMAIQVNGKLREAFGHELPLRLLLDAPTVAGLAHAMDEQIDGAGQGGGRLPDLVPDTDQLHAPFPLNPIQQAYWMGRMSTFELGGVAAQYYLEFEIPPVDMARVNRAWNAVIARHPMLRAVVRPNGTQQILPDLPTYTIELTDMRGWAYEDAAAERDALRERMAHQVLDPHQWPLFEFRATRVRDDVVRFHFHLDLLVADAWSAQILFSDFRRFMEHGEEGDQPPTLSFRDYLLADAALADSELTTASRRYWQERVPQLPGAPTLPLSKAPGSLDTPRFVRRGFRLPSDIWATLKSRAVDAGLTPSGMLLTAFGEVLARWSRVPHLCINATTFRRLPMHSEVNAVVGDFTSLTLLEVDCRNAASFEQRARTVQERLFQDLDHRYYSGVEVVRELAAFQGRAPGALMPVVFTSLLTRYEDAHAEAGEAPPVDEVFALSQTPQVWLDHQVIEEGGALRANWDAVEDLFPPGLLDQMFDAYQGLLTHLATDAAAWGRPAFARLPSVQEAARTAYNQTDLVLPGGSLFDLFLQGAEADADRPALITEDETVTYGALRRRAARVTNWLLEQGVATGEMVAVVADKGIPQVVAVLGALGAGAAYLPIDPDWPEARRTYILDHASVRLVLTDKGRAESLSWPADRRRLAVDGETAAHQADQAPAPVTAPEQRAYAIFTSGSTGLPKGVVVSHAAAVNTLRDINRRFAVGASDRVLALSALSFDLSVYDLFGVFAAGGAVVLPRPDALRDPAHWAALMDQAGVTLWNSVPALLELFADYLADRDAALPGNLRLALLSGDWLPLDIAARMHAHAPRMRVVSLGGATEAAVWSIFHEIGDVDAGWKSIPYGRPLANQRFYVLDGNLAPCPLWVPGELYIAGAGLADGYLGEEEKTAAAFISFQGAKVAGGPAPGERLYRTGDWGRFIPGDVIEFMGRHDAQVKIGGYRIELGEVEHALHACDGVTAGVALVLGDSRENRRLVAAYTADGDAAPDVEVLRAQLAGKLPTYMVPASLVRLDEMPLTANGKIDRKALAAMRFDQAAQAGQGPRTPLELEVARIWTDILEAPVTDVTTTLFEAGGNSLVAIRLLGALQDHFRLDVTLQSLFEQPTVAGLAEVVGRLKADAGEAGAATRAELTLVPMPEDADKPFPLSDIQQAYLLGRMEHLELGGVAAHAYFEIDVVHGDPARIQQVWRRLIDRHAMLRAVFCGGEQAVPADMPPFELTVNDWRDAEPEVLAASLEALRDLLSHQVLPTDQRPLFDLRASLLPEDRMRVHISFDLLIADAWSSQILFTEMGILARNPDAELPALDISFRDYMLALGDLEQTELYARSRAYWQARVPELPAAPELPLIADPAAMRAPRFTRFAAELPADAWGALKDHASRLGITPSGLCLAAYAEVLAAWSAAPRFTINVTTFNRLPLHPHVAHLVGDFTSLTLLAVDGALEGSVHWRARTLQERLWEDLDHRHYSGVQVVRDLAQALGRSPGALMPVVFTSRLFSGDQQPVDQDDALQGAEWVYSISQTPQVWLDMQVSEAADGALTWTWDAVEALFPADVLADMFAAYRQFLCDLAAVPERWDQPPAPMVPARQAELFAGYNDTVAAYTPITLAQLIAPAFRQHADAPAVIAADGSLTYAQLDRRAQHLARRLADLGVGRDQCVAVVMEKGLAQVVAAVAVTRGAGAYVPLDPEWPQARLDLLLAEANARIVLTQPHLAERPWPEGVTVLPVDAQTEVADAAADETPVGAAPDDLAYVIFTSGTTGKPKGVAIEHAAAANTLQDMVARFALGSADRVLGLSALTFDLSVFDVFGTLAAGGTLVLPAAADRRNPEAWAALAADHGVTVWNSVPALLSMFLEYADSHPGAVPETLRLALLSGDWLPLEIAERLQAHQPGAHTVSLGGATEASIWSIYHPVDARADGWASVPYGRPLANQRFYVLDAQLRPCPVWATGDLYIGGIGLAREYLGDADKTRGAFITHPETGERLYRTGDTGRMRPEGLIEFLGRRDTQVKVQGYRIELGEIEAVLGRHPEVGALVVEALGDPKAGRRLVAYVVPARDAAGAPCDPKADVLRAHVAASLPHYMEPSAFVFLDALPLSANGKVDRKALPAPEGLEESRDDLAAPRTPVERALAELWCELLNLERVGIDEDLFALGANSLIAIRLAAAVKERLGVELELRTLFEKTTIAGVAEVVVHLRAQGGGVVSGDTTALTHDAAGRYQPFPLNDVQQAYLLGRQDMMELGSVAAHSYTELDSETLEPERLEAIWRRLIEHHDMLRAVVSDKGTQRVMPYAELPPFTVPVQDLSDLSEADREAALLAWRDEMSHQVLPTDRWPLFDIRVSRLHAGKIRIHYSFDLLISDAWSSQLLTLQFAYLYAQPEVRLPELEVGFRDYVLAMDRKEHLPAYRKDRAYWRRRLDSLPGAPELPLAVDPAALGRPAFVRRHAHLDAARWEALRARCADLGVTPSALLMAAYAEALGAWSRRPRFCLNVTTFNRMPLHAHINDVVGDFTSLTLLEVDTGGEVPFALRARRVQEQLWVDLDHRAYSGVEVIRDLARARGQAPGALMPVVFTSRLFHDPRVAALEEENFAYGEVVYSVSQTPQVWIDAQVLEEGGRLIWSWDTVDALFPAGMMDDLFAAHTGLLERLADEAELWQRQRLTLLPEAHAAVYAAANNTDLDLGPQASGTMHDLVLAAAARAGDDTAVVDASRELSYSRLVQGACTVAHALHRDGARPGELIAVVMDKGWAQAVAVLGIQLAGAAYLPISPEWPENRRNRIFERGGVTRVLHDGAGDLPQQLPEGIAAYLVDDAVFTGEGVPPKTDVTPTDLAYVIFTSGSTGEPKGVAIEHHAAVNTLLDVNRRYGVTADDRVLALSELTFDLSVFDFFGIWAAGGACVIPPSDTRRDPAAWGRLGEAYGVSLWNTVPALLDMLVTYAAGNPGSLPPRLRLAMLSGDWLPVDIATRLHALKADARVVSMGGATEASIWSIFFHVPVPTPDWTSIPYGTPLANQRFYVLDDQLRSRPLCVPGELYIGGVGVAREYYGDPERTAASYIVHPDSGERLYRTGDMGRYLPDGNIEFLGREDNQVKVQGFRIELGDIEAALVRHPDLVAAVAAAPRIGEGRERRLVAYLVPRPGAQAPDAEAVRAHLGEHVPPYMIPSVFVMLDALPLTANGKVDRAALPEPGAERGAGARAARTPTEERMCAAWAELLGLESVGIDDNLFDLGGTSVTAIQLLNVIRETFGMELSMRTLFENLTVRALTLAMARARAGGEAEMVDELPMIVPDPAARHNPFPLNDIQQAYWVGRLGAFSMGSLGAHYYVEVDSDGLDLDGFSRAFRDCIRRHDALRLVFLPDGTQQILADVPDYAVEVEDLRDADATLRDARLAATRERLSHQVLPADVWPLFEVRATRIDARVTRLHLSFDLLLADAWSFQLLFRDMTALAKNPDSPLEPLELSFRDYVMGERRIAETDIYRRSEDYWMRRMDSMPGAPALPVQDAAQLDNPRFSRFDCGLDAEDWTRFQATASAAGVTATGALMAAFAQVLGAWSRDPRFCLNVTMFNRRPLHPQVNMILGDFTSMTLVEVDTRPAGDDDRFSLHARRIQERLWTDLDHDHFGGVKVLREMARRQGGAGAVTMPVVFTSRLFKIAGFDSQNAQGDRIGEVVYSISQTPQVWIDHQLTERDGALCLNWDVVADLFPQGMMDDLFAAYQRLLSLLAADAENWERPLPALVPEQHVCLLHDAASPAASVAPSVPALFARRCAAAPQARAVVADGLDGEVRLTYGELGARVAGIAARLTADGLHPGDTVAVCCTRGWAHVAAVLGVWAAGGVVLPLDAARPEGFRKTALTLGRARRLLTQHALLETCAYPDLQPLAVDRLQSADALPADTAMPGRDAAAYVVVAGTGDGGLAAVRHTHAVLADQVAAVAAAANLSGDDHVAALVNPGDDAGLFHLALPLTVGARLILPKPGFDGHAAYQRTYAATQQVGLVLAASTAADVWAGVPNLRLVLRDGEPTPAAQAVPTQADLPVGRLSGSIEGGPWALYAAPGSADGLMGVPLTAQRALVLDARLQPRPAWVPGPVYLVGDGLCDGYQGDPVRDRAQFQEAAHPLDGTPTRLMATGLIGRTLPDGSLELLDSMPHAGAVRDDVGGREAETLLAACEGVARAAVVPRRDAAGDTTLVAYVQRRTEAAAAPAGAPPMVGAGGTPPAMPQLADAPALDARFKQLRFEPVFTPLERLQFKLARHWRRADLESYDGFRLAVPEDADSETARFIHRRSRRRFLDAPTPAGAFAALLELLRAVQPKGVPLPKYRYPSGGGLYPVMVYVAVEAGRVEGLEGGIYYYHPFEHALHKLHDSAPAHHFHAPENAAIVRDSAFTLFFIGRLGAVSPLYLDRGKDFCFLEAGYMGQLLMDEAPDTLGLCPLGGMAFEPVRPHFQLDDTDLLVHVMVGGHVDPKPLPLAEAFLHEQLDARDFAAMTEAKAVVTSGEDAAQNDGPNWEMKPFEEPDWAQQAVFDPIARLQFKMEKKGVRRDLDAPINLAAHAVDDLDAVYARRRSYRHYQRRGISQPAFGRWLAGLRSVQGEGMPLPKYRYPSGGGLYPVQVYLHLKQGAVEGLAQGLYYYEPVDHALYQIEVGTVLPGELHGPPNRPIEAEASFSVFMVGKYGAVAPLYPALARDFCLLESGYMGQLLEDTGLAHGIGLTPLGGMDFEVVRDRFRLDEDADLVHVFVGGAVSDENVGLRKAFAEQNQPHGAARVELEDLQQRAAERLPAARVPARYVFLDRLPKTPLGLLDRAALPDPDTAGTAEVLTAPETEAQRTVAEVWCEILGLEEVGIDQNFFEIGGTSVQMVQLHGRLQERFGVVFALVDLFEHPSVRTQAAYFETAAEGFDMREAREQAAKRKAARGRRRGKR